MNTKLFRLALVLTALVFGTVALRAEDLNTVRTRMAQRIPQIDELKTQGALGENNVGFLEVRSAANDAETIASAENSDRREVYAAIARKTGASADSVGRARARQIAGNSAPGVWIQRENGEWVRK